MFWKTDKKEKQIKVEEMVQDKKIKKVENEQTITNFIKNLLSCDHYEYELKHCESYKNKIHNYYRGESTQDCSNFRNLYFDCLKYEEYPTLDNIKLAEKLHNYENQLIIKRKMSQHENDIWRYRKEPPTDWNAKLPDWALERLKDTVWYKELNIKE